MYVYGYVPVYVYMYMIPFAEHWNVRYTARSNSWSLNLHFATISRDRPTESCERVHPAEWKCASRYSGVHAKIWKCKFRYSGVRKMYEVWGGVGDHTMGGGGGWDPGSGLIYRWISLIWKVHHDWAPTSTNVIPQVPRRWSHRPDLTSGTGKLTNCLLNLLSKGRRKGLLRMWDLSLEEVAWNARQDLRNETGIWSHVFG